MHGELYGVVFVALGTVACCVLFCGFLMLTPRSRRHDYL